MTTIRRSAGRLQACLATTPLAIDPAADVLRESLGELRDVLAALLQTIADATTKARGA